MPVRSRGCRGRKRRPHTCSERTTTPSWNGYTVTFETGMPVVRNHVPGGVRVVRVLSVRFKLVRACLYHGRSVARTRGRMTADAYQRLVGFGRMRRRMERMFAERVRHGRLPSSAAALASKPELSSSSSSSSAVVMACLLHLIIKGVERVSGLCQW